MTILLGNEHHSNRKYFYLHERLHGMGTITWSPCLWSNGKQEKDMGPHVRYILRS